MFINTESKLDLKNDDNNNEYMFINTESKQNKTKN